MLYDFFILSNGVFRNSHVLFVKKLRCHSSVSFCSIFKNYFAKQIICSIFSSAYLTLWNSTSKKFLQWRVFKKNSRIPEWQSFRSLTIVQLQSGGSVCRARTLTTLNYVITVALECVLVTLVLSVCYWYMKRCQMFNLLAFNNIHDIN